MPNSKPKGLDVSRYLSLRDDGDPSVTFRGLVLGTGFAAFASVVTMLYTFKPTQVSVSAIFLELLVYAAGNIWYLATPNPERIKTKWLRNTLKFLNFGQPFRIKEHAVASLIASSSNNGLSGVEVMLVENLFYGRTPTATTVVLGTFSISLIGFVLAGVTRSITVFPAEQVYWSTLPQVALFQSLHFEPQKNKGPLKVASVGFFLSCIWEVVAAYMMPFVGGISVFCLASMKATKKTRQVFANIFGGVASNEGLGLFSIGLDWQYIGSTYMSLPLKQQANSWIGLALFWILLPTLYYTNAWQAKKYPFMSSELYKEDGTLFDIQQVLDTDSPVINPTKLKEYGYPHFPASYAFVLFTANAAIGALIVHVLLFYAKPSWQAVKSAIKNTQPDPHYQAMLKYKDVPMWWYGVLFILAFVAGIIVNAKGDTTLPVWAYIVALLLGSFIAPFSMILYGLYGNGIATNSLSKMVGGVLVQNRPIANLYFASWSHQAILLAVNLSNWLKLGQYLKISHRVMFFTQVYSSLLGAYINYAIGISVVNAQRPILTNPVGSQVWSGANMQSLNTQAIAWSLSRDMFRPSGPYFIVPMGIIVGFGFPVLHWGLLKLSAGNRSLYNVVRHLNTPIIIMYAGWTSSGNTSYFFSTILVGLFSQLIFRRYYPGPYRRHNYLLGAALDGGSQTIIFILSYAVFGASGKVCSLFCTLQFLPSFGPQKIMWLT